MAKNLVDEMLIGIGFEVDSDAKKNVDNALNSIGDQALKLGAIMGAGFGVSELTLDYANINDELGKFTRTLGVSTSKVHAMQEAIIGEGGSVRTLRGDLASLDVARRRLRQGDTALLQKGALIGVDLSDIRSASNTADAYVALADKFQGLSKERRRDLAEILGFDESSVRLLQKGRASVEKEINRQISIRDVDRDMTNAAERWNGSLQDFENHIGAVGDTISKNLLPPLTDVIDKTNSWFDSNQKIINQNVGLATRKVGDNLGVVASSLGAISATKATKVLSGLSKYLPILGKLAGLTKMFSVIGWTVTALQLFSETKFGGSLLKSAGDTGSMMSYAAFGVDPSDNKEMQKRIDDLKMQFRERPNYDPNYIVGTPKAKGEYRIVESGAVSVNNPRYTFYITESANAQETAQMVKDEIQRDIDAHIETQRKTKLNNVK